MTTLEGFFSAKSPIYIFHAPVPCPAHTLSTESTGCSQRSSGPHMARTPATCPVFDHLQH